MNCQVFHDKFIPLFDLLEWQISWIETSVGLADEDARPEIELIAPHVKQALADMGEVWNLEKSWKDTWTSKWSSITFNINYEV